jgi:hypothetical protein
MHCELWVERLASSNSFKIKSFVISCLQLKKYASFAKLLNGKTKQQIVAVVAEKLCLHFCMILLKEFKQLYKDPLFLVKVSSYNSIFAFTSMRASLMENARIDEQLGKKTSSEFKEQ